MPPISFHYHTNYPHMKFLLPILLCFFLQNAFAQEARSSKIDSAEYSLRLFEGRLTRLHEAFDKKDASTMVAAYANLLGDMRQEIDVVSARAPESPQLTAMQSILDKFEAYSFDPAKPEELKPYITRFDEFYGLMRKERSRK